MAEIFDSAVIDIPPVPPKAEPPRTPPRLVLPPQGFGEDGFGYEGFGMTVAYAWDSGLRGAPLCGAARERTVFWRAHCERTYKVITCVASRMLLTPQMPNISTGDANDVLIHREISMPSREFTADGSDRIVVAQRLVFICQYAQELEGPILVPNSILDLTDVKQLDPTKFLSILNLSIPPTEASGVSAVTF